MRQVKLLRAALTLATLQLTIWIKCLRPDLLCQAKGREKKKKRSFTINKQFLSAVVSGVREVLCIHK